MKISNFPSIELTLLEKLRPYEVSAKTLVSRTLLGPIARNGQLKTNVRRFRKLNERKCCAIASWFLGDLGFLIREDLRELSRKWSYEERIEVELLIQSRAACFEFILNNYSDSDFFGNLVNNVVKVASKLRCFVSYPRRAVRIQRHRGYRDHGSCRPKECWLPSSDWSFTEKQNKIEEERKVHDNTYQFLLGFMGII
jgi:hypothetical protein